MQSVKIPVDFFAKTDKIILKLVYKFKGPRTVKTIFKKKSRVGGLTLPNFKTYYKASVIKTEWNWQKDPYGIKSPEINSNICGQLICHKGARQYVISITGRMIFSKIDTETIRYPYVKE